MYFGTGKYYETADQDPANAVQYNTMYGIWDRDIGTNYIRFQRRTKWPRSPRVTPSVLQQQTIDTQTASDSTYAFDSNTYRHADGQQYTDDLGHACR